LPLAIPPTRKRFPTSLSLSALPQLSHTHGHTLLLILYLQLGNYSDLLVIVLHKMIVSGLDKLSALYNCFLTIICNVSPYCKCLGTVAAVKIVNLFQLFMSPRFLYATESNSVYVALILETLNNIVQYQYEGNVNIVYAIIRRSVDHFSSYAAPMLPSSLHSSPFLSSRMPRDYSSRECATISHLSSLCPYQPCLLLT
jgi:Dyggve-Melchior-Clausen syndrome protein